VGIGHDWRTQRPLVWRHRRGGDGGTRHFPGARRREGGDAASPCTAARPGCDRYRGAQDGRGSGCGAGLRPGRGGSEWAGTLGSPTIGKCWHYSDVGGRQESITVTFGYGAAEHALSVLIDHGRGGKIKDAWVDDAEGLLDKTWLAAENDPLIVFEPIEAKDASERLTKAVATGEYPTKPDETDDLTAHRALLHARVRYLAEN
jgi:hypothetical protein